MTRLGPPNVPQWDARLLSVPPELVETVARAIYCDGTRMAYGLGADPTLWAAVSEEQRALFRFQARAAIAAYRLAEAVE